MNFLLAVCVSGLVCSDVPPLLEPFVDSPLLERLLQPNRPGACVGCSEKPIESLYPLLTDAGKQGFADLCATALARGRMLSPVEAAKVLFEQPDAFTWKDYGTAYFLFINAQDSRQLSNDLQAAWSIRREKLRRCIVRYREISPSCLLYTSDAADE